MTISVTIEDPGPMTLEQGRDVARRWSDGERLDEAEQAELFEAVRSRPCSTLMMGHMLGIQYCAAIALAVAASAGGEL